MYQVLCSMSANENNQSHQLSGNTFCTSGASIRPCTYRLRWPTTSVKWQQIFVDMCRPLYQMARGMATRQYVCSILIDLSLCSCFGKIHWQITSTPPTSFESTSKNKSLSAFHNGDAVSDGCLDHTFFLTAKHPLDGRWSRQHLSTFRKNLLFVKIFLFRFVFLYCSSSNLKISFFSSPSTRYGCNLSI